MARPVPARSYLCPDNEGGSLEKIPYVLFAQLSIDTNEWSDTLVIMVCCPQRKARGRSVASSHITDGCTLLLQFIIGPARLRGAWEREMRGGDGSVAVVVVDAHNVCM
jgi:hypothetical protein